jgi:hypothetical protein
MKQLLTTVAVLAIASAAHADMSDVGEWQGDTPASPPPAEFCSFDNVKHGTFEYSYQTDWEKISTDRMIHTFSSSTDTVEVTFTSRGAAYILSEPFAVYAGATDVTELFETDNFEWELDEIWQTTGGDSQSHSWYGTPLEDQIGQTKRFGFGITGGRTSTNSDNFNGSEWNRDNSTTTAGNVQNLWYTNESDKFYLKKKVKHVLTNNAAVQDTGTFSFILDSALPAETVVPYDQTWTFQVQITCVM